MNGITIWLLEIDQEITNHLGKKPIRGGSPAKENIFKSTTVFKE